MNTASQRARDATNALSNASFRFIQAVNVAKLCQVEYEKFDEMRSQGVEVNPDVWDFIDSSLTGAVDELSLARVEYEKAKEEYDEAMDPLYY
ncbi:MAG: hypothetical protein OXU36_10625 [Candidatus Poribacteria bacterium]|nr:hypothetical protein [Candidatus Poribacteria bacterium]